MTKQIRNENSNASILMLYSIINKYLYFLLIYLNPFFIQRMLQKLNVLLL